MNGEDSTIPECVPIFPLPEVVLFPRAVLPLHIFEPRYVEMTSDALAGNSVIAISLLKEGFQPVYYSRRAPIHAVVCVGRIVASERVSNGKYNILLRGESRARIVKELSGRAYRRAEVERLPTSSRAPKRRLAALRKSLRDMIRDNDAADPETADNWKQLFDAHLPLGDVADVIASGLPVIAELRQCLLSEPDAPTRAKMLLEHMRTLAALDRCQRRASHGGDWAMN